MNNNKNKFLQKTLPIFLIIIFNIFFITKIAQAATLLTDDFVGTTIDTVKWTEIDAAGSGGSAGKIQQNNSLTINGDGSWGEYSISKSKYI